MKKPETKLQLVRRMISRKRGASSAELVEATGWVEHSLSGALSRLRKAGLTIQREDERRGRVYRVVTT
jgi:DNA-binding transcriptional regulator PaaX